MIIRKVLVFFFCVLKGYSLVKNRYFIKLDRLKKIEKYNKRTHFDYSMTRLVFDNLSQL